MRRLNVWIRMEIQSERRRIRIKSELRMRREKNRKRKRRKSRRRGEIGIRIGDEMGIAIGIKMKIVVEVSIDGENFLMCEWLKLLEMCEESLKLGFGNMKRVGFERLSGSVSLGFNVMFELVECCAVVELGIWLESESQQVGRNVLRSALEKITDGSNFEMCIDVRVLEG